MTSTPGNIEHAQSPLSDISRQLGQIGGPEKFATRLTVTPAGLHLEVRGVGRIRFPVTPSTARKLIKVARPARMHILVPHLHRICHDLAHTTRRIGSPFTLMLAKTNALFEREAAEREIGRQELRWLEKTTADF